MLTEKDINDTQQNVIDHLYENGVTLLVACTGYGKTIVCLTAINELIADGHIKRVIVACPAKVVSTKVWSIEADKWEHLKGLRVREISGSPGQRLHRLQEEASAHVIVVSLNNLAWMLKQKHGADGIIVDELSKAAGKQARGLRTKSKGDCFTWRVGMTATPVSQDFEKLQPMCRIMDGGKALGRNKDNYLKHYGYTDYNGYNWTPHDWAPAVILDRIKHLVHLVEDTKSDDLPPLLEHTMRFDMPTKTRAIYDQMKAEMVVETVEAANEAVKSGKLRQIASGFLYEVIGHTRTGKVINKARILDTARVNAMIRWHWSLNGRPGIIYYEYVEHLDAIKHHFRGNQFKQLTEDIDEFKAGEWQLLAAQFNSMSHGVDGLQHVCHDALIYHPLWSRDATEQAMGRLWRTGQRWDVDITTLVCEGTLDDLVMERVEDRAEWMKIFRVHLEGGAS